MKTSICQVCSKQITHYPSQPRKYCSNKCRYTAIRTGPALKPKTGKICRCGECGNEFYVQKNTLKVDKGKFCSKECYWKNKASDNPVEHRFYNSAKWRTTRRIVRARDGNKCVLCDSKKNLEVHHIININKCEDKCDLDNLITLCHMCHNKAHKRYS